MALTGVVQRRDAKSVIIANPPRVGEIVYALDTEEYGSLQNGILIWKKFDDIIKSVAGRVGDVTLSKFDVGLENVDNIADIDKPVSTATQIKITEHTSMTNPHGVTTTLLGLEKVDNTADIDKPISTSTSNYIDNIVGNLTEIDNALNLGGLPASSYALVLDYFDKIQTQDLLNSKADKVDTYNITDTDLLLNLKSDKTALQLTDQKLQVLEISNAGKADTTYVDAKDLILDTAKAEKSALLALEVVVTGNTDDIVLNRTTIDNNVNDITVLQLGKADKSYTDTQDTNLQNQVTTNTNDILNLVAGGVTKTYVDTQDDNLQNQITVLNQDKANIIYVDSEIAKVAPDVDKLYVDAQDVIIQTQINTINTTKADRTFVIGADDNLQAQIDSLSLAGASTTYVDAQDTILSDSITTVANSVANLEINKADITYVNAQDTDLQTQIANLTLSNNTKVDQTIYDARVIAVDLEVTDLFINKADITYVDSLISGLAAKAAVRATSTSNILLSGLQTLDGVVLAAGDRVLVKDQTILSENGIYLVNVGTWLRSADADNNLGSEVNNGMYCFVLEGTLNDDTGWILSAPDPVVLGTSALLFNKFSNVTLNATDLLNKLKTVDGSGSGLDADLLDGNTSLFYASKTYVDTQDTALQSQINTNVANIDAINLAKADITYVDTQDTALQTQITSNATSINIINTTKADIGDAMAFAIALG